MKGQRALQADEAVCTRAQRRRDSGYFQRTTGVEGWQPSKLEELGKEIEKKIKDFRIPNGRKLRKRVEVHGGPHAVNNPARAATRDR